ncbi:MAG: ATP-binding protein [bacterium]
MFSKSLYPRVISIVAGVSLILFAILALVNTLLVRNAIIDLARELEAPRIMRLFRVLDQAFQHDTPVATIKAKIDSMYFEYNVELFDKSGNWITGTYSPLQGLVVSEQSRQIQGKEAFTGFTHTYYNPNPHSSFHAIKIHLQMRNTPILRRVFFSFLICGLVVIAVSVVIGWRLVAYLNMRLDRLKSGVSKIANGQFDVRLEDREEDEIGFLAQTFNDMSQRIQRLIKRLEESNAARQRLIAHASHEIKSPLTSIRGFLDIVEFTHVLSEEQQKHLLPTVKKDLNRVIKITNDMLQLAQIREPTYKPQLKAINVHKFFLEEHSFFAHKAAVRQVQAILDSQVDDRLELETDPERLSQILDNLWNNALKYGDLTRPIRTELFLQNQSLAIKISNHLKGLIAIPAERLFMPFYRGANSSETVSGSGLGLAIVKELTEKLGGSLSPQLSENRFEITVVFPLPSR